MIDLSHIEVIALDFDGTLLEQHHLILPETIEALHRAADAGVRIATASGRPEDNQREILSANGLHPGVGLPHALSCDERTIWLLDGDGYVELTQWNDFLVTEWQRLRPLAEQLMLEFEAELRAEGQEIDRHVVGDDIDRRGIIDRRFPSEADCTRCGPRLLAKVAKVTDELRVTWNWHLLQIIAGAAGKGNSLAALARHWGLEPSAILAVGDRNNDVSMLNGSAGLTPAAVGNAVPEIKELVVAQGGYLATAETGLGVAEIADKVVADRARRG